MSFVFCLITRKENEQLTVELWRPAPDQTIKTDSPTQGDTQEKVPLLGSPTNDLLAGPPGEKTPLN
jgi:hypothetical protein